MERTILELFRTGCMVSKLLPYSQFKELTRLNLSWLQPNAILNVIHIDLTDKELMQVHASTLIRAGHIWMPKDIGSDAYNKRVADIQRGMLGELALEYALRRRNLVFKYNAPISSDSDLDIDWDMISDFQLKAEKGPDITLETKTCPESFTMRGAPYRYACIRDGIMDADYCVPVKIVEHISPGSSLWIAGFKTRAEIDKIELIEKGESPCTLQACKPIDLEQPMPPIEGLLDMLDRECLHWDTDSPSLQDSEHWNVSRFSKTDIAQT